MAFSKQLLFLLLLSLTIFRDITSSSSSFSSSSSSSSSSSENNDCYKLKSNALALQLVIKEEKIQALESFIKEKSYLFESELDFSQADSLLEHESEPERKIYQLQKQVYGLKREVELQRKRRLEVETRAQIADKKFEELSSKLEIINRKSFSSMLGLNLNKTQAHLMTIWQQHLRPTLHITLRKVSLKIDQVQKWSEPHIEALNSKWIPSIKDASVTLAIYLEPKVQYLTHKSIEVLYTSKQALTPHLINGLDVSYYYLEVIRAHTHPYTSQIMTIVKPHMEKVQVSLEPYTENVRYGFKKLVNSTKIYHQQAQEMLKNNAVTKPVATMDLAWVAATALVGFPLIFIIKLLSAVSNPKGKKRCSHKKEPITGYRRAKRRHPH